MVSKEPEFFKNNIFIGKTLRLFLSYSHKDKRIAGAIKEAFNHYGMEAFLAHEDIQIGQDWRNTILNNLKQFDVFVAVISKNFTESDWTDWVEIKQEKIKSETISKETSEQNI